MGLSMKVEACTYLEVLLGALFIVLLYSLVICNFNLLIIANLIQNLHTMDENTVEYLTIEACTADIELAVRNNLTPLSGKLIACGLIDGAQSRQLTNRMLDETDRAHQLVQFVQAKVAGNKKHYSSFVKDVLGANRAHYRDIIEYLETKYREIERKCSFNQKYSQKVQIILHTMIMSSIYT